MCSVQYYNSWFLRDTYTMNHFASYPRIVSHCCYSFTKRPFFSLLLQVMEKLVDIVHSLHLEIHDAFGSAGMHWENINDIMCIPGLVLLIVVFSPYKWES